MTVLYPNPRYKETALYIAEWLLIQMNNYYPQLCICYGLWCLIYYSLWTKKILRFFKNFYIL